VLRGLQHTIRFIGFPFVELPTLLVIGFLGMAFHIPVQVSAQTEARQLIFEIPVPEGIGTRYDRVTNSIVVTNRINVLIVYPEGFKPVGGIFYTLDGSAPSSAAIPGQVAQITNSVTLRAIAYNSDFSDSISGQLVVEVVPRFFLNFADNVVGFFLPPVTNLISVSPEGNAFAPGTVLSITANDREGWFFDHWTNALAGFATNRTATLVMDADKTVGARYITRVSTTVSNGAGQIQVSPEWATYRQSVTVTAVPANGSYFVGWGSPPGGSNYPVEVPITSGTQLVSAAFAPLSADHVTLTVRTNLSLPVFVSPKKNVYSRGETVSLSPFSGGLFRFVGWSGDASGFDRPLTLVLDSNKTVQANFEQVSWQSVGVEPSFTGNLHAPVIAGDGTVYVARETTLLSLTPSLQTNWVLTTGLRYHSIPTIGESGTIYVAGGNGDVAAVRTNGTIAWTFTSGHPHPFYGEIPEQTVRPQPMTLSADETIYVAPLTSTNVYVVKNGSLVRTISPLSEAPDNKRMPVIGPDGALYLASTGGFSAQTPQGVEKWSAPFPKPSAIDANGRLYSISGTNIIALSFNGNHLWTASLSAPVQEVLLGEAGRIFARSEHGLAALQTNGTLLWTNETQGPFVPLADGGVLVVRGIQSSDERCHETYQNITADGKNGPYLAMFVGSSRWPISAGIPVVSKWGDIYTGWGGSPFFGGMSHITDNVPLARSSWPLPFGLKNTGRAIPLPVPRLSIGRKGAGLVLRGSGFEERAMLESSTDLEDWSPVEEFSAGFVKDIQPEGRAFYRLRQ
jgi:hypothetical protein